MLKPSTSFYSFRSSICLNVFIPKGSWIPIYHQDHRTGRDLTDLFLRQYTPSRNNDTQYYSRLILIIQCPYIQISSFGCKEKSGIFFILSITIFFKGPLMRHSNVSSSLCISLPSLLRSSFVCMMLKGLTVLGVGARQMIPQVHSCLC